MPRVKKVGTLSTKAKKARMRCVDLIRGSRWSDKENIPPPNPSGPVFQSSASELQSKVSILTTRLRSTQRALQRAKKKVTKEAEHADVAITQERESTKAHNLIVRTLKNDVDVLTRTQEAMHIRIQHLLESKKVAQRKIHSLQQKIRRFTQRLGHASTMAKKNMVLRLRMKGIYTVQARSLTRSLVHSGCAPKKVGAVIRQIAQTMGINVVGNISPRTVQRVQLEGLVASDIQAGFELGSAKSVTISQDSTSNRHVNFESHHYMLQAPDYSKGETAVSQASDHKVRLLRVGSTLDHSSEKSREKWLEQLKDIEETYGSSPLGQQSQAPKFLLRHFALILKGMHGDHASAEKGTVNLMKDWKREETLLDLGEQKLTGQLKAVDIAELLVYLARKKAEYVEKLGGADVWDQMSSTDRSRHEECLMREIKLEVGTETYTALSDYDRRMLDLFLWAGCCMHKDLNSFKGGNSAMMEYWEKHGLPAPIPLANKFNAQKIRDILDPSRKDSPITAEEQTALENTTRGGAKAAALAGALFNNKDDKKGYGDTYQMFREAEDVVQKVCARFPDTSNTRFNSHAEAAAELLVHLEFYLRFLEHVRDAKKVPGWTNIEVNLWKALRDVSTLTELAAMVLYAQAITHPYLRKVRGRGTEKTNVLDLGPLHARVRAHCEKIIENPAILVSIDATYTDATLDGLEWENSDAVDAVKAMLPELPHLQCVVQAFFEGALATWIRFSAEFAPGGLIDTANAEEKRLAWMPSTNDTNEGALGAYRVYMRNKPSTTLLQYNAYAVWERNDTQSFMDTLFTEADHAYTRRKARELDRKGMERERKRELREFGQKQVAIRREKEVQKRVKAETRRAQLLKVVISSEDSNLGAMKVLQLDEQLDALKEIYNDAEVPNKTARGKKEDKINLLREAIRRFNQRKDELQDTVSESLTSIVTSWEEEEMEMEMEDD